MGNYFFCVLLIISCCGHAFSQAEAGKGGQEHARKVASSLPSDNFLRRLVEDGRFGDGVERPWQVQMRQFGIKAAAVEVHMIWFFGPRRLTPVRVVYYESYGGREQITDPANLSQIRSSGVERKLAAEAIRLAPQGHWIDLPLVFWPFRAATAVTMWDDPWLPTPPHLFTTFGPGRPPLVAAVGFGDLADIDRMLASGKIDRKAINDALWFACSDRDPTILQRLLKAGADVNQTRAGERGTCLMSAIGTNASETVKVLLVAGAKVNGVQGQYDETPLTLAASNGSQSTEIVTMLLDAGADVKALNSYGMTALMKAAGRKPEPASVVELLVGHGADVNARTHTGSTALAFAAERGNVEAIQVLLAAHADVNARDDRGRSVIDIAADKQVADLLTAAGAKR
jgi:ankyrin repeat protein